MTPDYDLSSLETSQSDLWLFLRVDAIRAEILADQAKRLALPLALGSCAVPVITEKPQATLNSVQPGANVQTSVSENKAGGVLDHAFSSSVGGPDRGWCSPLARQ
jgi:hypothetical protein